MIEAAFVSYGVRVSVRVAAPEWLAAARERFPPGCEAVPGGPSGRVYSLTLAEAGGRSDAPSEYVLSVEAKELIRSPRLAEALDSFESDSRLYIAEMTTQYTFLHAGAVGWNGQGVIIPGRSWSGKTTLVAELVKAGATYFSDEYAVLDHEGRLHPYPKPLSIREGEANAQINYPIEHFGGRAASGSLPVGLVILSQYSAGSVWAPTKLSTGNGLLAVGDNSISIRRSPQMVLTALGKALSGAEVIQGTRGEARQVVDYLRQHHPWP